MQADGPSIRHHPDVADSDSSTSTSTSTEPDPRALIQIARMRMPFGRYEGRRLIDLPEPYVVWFRNKGYPRGHLGELLATLYEIKSNGLEPLLASFREPTDPLYRSKDPRDFREGDR